VNRRGGASVAALSLAAVLATGALAIAGSLRRRERRSFDTLSTTAARAAIFAQAVDATHALPGDARMVERTFSALAGGQTLRVTVVWKRQGERWSAVLWKEEGA